MIDPATFEKWQDWSKRDDGLETVRPDDIRQMLGEIERLRERLRAERAYWGETLAEDN